MVPSRTVLAPSKTARRTKLRRVKHGQNLDLVRVQRLFNEAFGHGYISLGTLQAKVRDPNPASAVFTATVADTIVGAATCGPVTETFHQQLVDHLPDVFGSLDHAGWLQSSAVDPAWQRKGIGSLLLDRRLRLLRQNGCKSAVAVVWNYQQPSGSAGLLQTVGFQPQGTIPGYWRQDSILRGYSCPNCGPVCECPATIFLNPDI